MIMKVEMVKSERSPALISLRAVANKGIVRGYQACVMAVVSRDEYAIIRP